jgi:hypothetical protein
MMDAQLEGERRIGRRRGAGTNGRRRWLEVAVVGSVHDPGAPRVVVHIGPDERTPPVCGDSWYLLDAEARALTDWLLAGAQAARAGQAHCMGRLTAPGPLSHDWLTVETVPQQPPAGEGPLWVQLQLDDALLAEAGTDNILRFPPGGAAAVARLLTRALAEAVERPPPLVERR